jgi:hypothetical protein
MLRKLGDPFSPSFGILLVEVVAAEWKFKEPPSAK